MRRGRSFDLSALLVSRRSTHEANKSSTNHNDKFHDAMTFSTSFPNKYKKMHEQWEKYFAQAFGSE